MWLTQNFVDLVVILFILVSGIWGYLSGFVREMSKLLAWLISFFATYYAVPPLIPLFDIQPVIVGYIVLVPVFFIFIFVIVSIFSRMVEHLLTSHDAIGFTNRMMGLSFGLIRGFGIICLMYLLATLVPDIPGKNEPQAFVSARVRPLVLYGSEVIGALLHGRAEIKRFLRDTRDILDVPTEEGRESQRKGLDVSSGSVVFVLRWG